MSFGYSVSDFITLLNLANTIRKQFADAPNQFNAISNDVKVLSNVLRDVDDILPQRDVSSQQMEYLDEISQGCLDVLNQLKEKLDKNQELDSKVKGISGKSGRMWKRFLWDQEEIDQFRNRVSLNITAFGTFLGRITRCYLSLSLFVVEKELIGPSVRLLEDASANTANKSNSSQVTHHSLKAGISKSDVSPTNSGGYQASLEAREQVGVVDALILDKADKPNGQADISDSDSDISVRSISNVESIFSTIASQSSATTIDQAPPEAREQAEDAIACVLAKNHGVSTIVARGVEKLGHQRAESLMAKALRQFSSTIKPSLDKDNLLRISFTFIEHRAVSIARKIRDITQSVAPAVSGKTALKKHLGDMHSHKVTSLERVRPWQESTPDTSDEPLTSHESELTDGEEGEGEDLGETSEIKRSLESDKSEELGESLLRQITEYLASDKVSSDFLCAVKDSFLKTNDRQGPVGGPEPENEGKEPHRHPSVADESLEQDGKYLTNAIECGLAPEAIEIPVLVPVLERVIAVTAAPQVCTDKWPAFFADGKTDICFDDRNLWSLSNEMKGWIENKIGARVNWWPLSARRKPLPDGFSRVSWKCRCGRRLSGIMSIARKFRYERWLSAHNGELPAQSIRLSSVDQEGDLGLATTSGSSNGTSSFPPSSHQNPPCADGTGQGNLSSGQDRTTDELYLLWCVNSGNFRQRLGRRRPTVVRSIRVARDDKDEKVFKKLREVYDQTRGYWWLLSLHAVEEIRYVRFKKYRQDRVTCYSKQELPKKTDTEYVYCLPGDEQPEIPLIPVDELMEYFGEPSCAGTLNHATESFPKKRNEKIRKKIAWGLHACEELSFLRVLILLGLVLAGTILFVPFWLLKRPYDLQNAFVPPFFFLALAGVFIGVSARCTSALPDPDERRSPPDPDEG